MAILRSYGDKTRVLYLVHAFPPEHLHFLVGACCCCSRLKLIQSLQIRCCQWLMLFHELHRHPQLSSVLLETLTFAVLLKGSKHSTVLQAFAAFLL